MTNQQDSHFNQRADNAALMLKKGMTDSRTEQPLEPTPVVVGPDGQPPAAPPPEGSYAAMALEQQRAQAAQHVQPQPVPQQPQVAGTQPTQPLPPQAPQQESQGELSPNAQSRFSEMSARLRQMEQQLQASQEEARARATTEQELRTALENARTQQEELLRANLDELEPDVRAQVMADQRIQERMDDMERRMAERFMPHIQSLELERQQQHMVALANKYPAFDVSIHAPLIETFRAGNPNATVEQAFRAIAQDGELVTRDSAPLQAAPPIVSPSGVSGAQPRYMPEPEPDTEAQMRADAQRAYELMRANNHADRKEGMRLVDKNLAERLGRILPR